MDIYNGCIERMGQSEIDFIISTIVSRTSETKDSLKNQPITYLYSLMDNIALESIVNKLHMAQSEDSRKKG